MARPKPSLPPSAPTVSPDDIEQSDQEAWIVATNAYLLGAHGWRLVAHHASPGAAGELQDQVEAASVLH